MGGRGGSRKPILDLVPGTGSRLDAGSDADVRLPLLDGRSLSAIDVLLEVGGDWEIACERTGLSEPEFARELARNDPEVVAEAIRAIHLMQISRLASAIGGSLIERLDEAKPGQLIGLYPKLIELIPLLTQSKLRVADHRSVNFTFPQSANVPPEIAEALKALGMLGG